MRSNLSITAGLRWDWDGGLTEKYGNLSISIRRTIHYDPIPTPFASNGLIVAGNNQTAATPEGVSNSTLTGRQWGFAPRIGVAWSPKLFNNKLVVRAGWGMYYDRGELFAYLSPGTPQNIITGGPFGINQSQPFVSTQFRSSNPARFTKAVILACMRSLPGTREHRSAESLARSATAPGQSGSQCRMLPNTHHRIRTPFLPWRLRAEQQASLYDEQHAGHSVAAPQRFGN